MGQNIDSAYHFSDQSLGFLHLVSSINLGKDCPDSMLFGVVLLSNSLAQHFVVAKFLKTTSASVHEFVEWVP